jgi:hypothetical protein
MYANEVIAVRTLFRQRTTNCSTNVTAEMNGRSVLLRQSIDMWSQEAWLFWRPVMKRLH